MQHHGKSSRKRKAKLALTYVFMTLAVGAISIVSILLVLGYRFDFQKRDVEAGGLVQMNTSPVGATVYFDGELLSAKTPTKRSVGVGAHTIRYEKAGYESWEKTVNVRSGELRWVNYARLVPSDVATSPLRTFKTLVRELPSPDKKWIIAQAASSQPSFTVIDIRSDTPAYTTLQIPVNKLTRGSGTHTYELVEWDFGARYVLVKHTVGKVIEFIRIDRTDEDNSVNLSTTLGLSLQDVHFSGKSGAVFYGLSNGQLRKLDVDAGTISRPIQEGVTRFELYRDNDIVYVRDTNTARIVGLYDGENRNVVASFDKKLPVAVDVSSYFSDIYVAVQRGKVLDVYKNSGGPAMSRIAHKIDAKADTWVMFSNNGRFAVSGAGARMMTYDLETKETYKFTLPGAAPKFQPPRWLDDYMFVWTSDDTLRWAEFDGSNVREVAPVAKTSRVTLNSDGEKLYSFVEAKSGAYTLQVSDLVVAN